MTDFRSWNSTFLLGMRLRLNRTNLSVFRLVRILKIPPNWNKINLGLIRLGTRLVRFLKLNRNFVKLQQKKNRSGSLNMFWSNWAKYKKPSKPNIVSSFWIGLGVKINEAQPYLCRSHKHDDDSCGSSGGSMCGSFQERIQSLVEVRPLLNCFLQRSTTFDSLRDYGTAYHDLQIDDTDINIEKSVPSSTSLFEGGGEDLEVVDSSLLWLVREANEEVHKRRREEEEGKKEK